MIMETTRWQIKYRRGKMHDVCNTAKFVYPENFAKLSRFIISESTSKLLPATDVPLVQ